MCELPLPKLSWLIRQEMFRELPIEPLRVTIVIKPLAAEEIAKIVRLLKVKNDPFFMGDAPERDFPTM